jgi:TPR repeat protein
MDLFPKGEGDRAAGVAKLDAACKAKVAHACTALGSWTRWSMKDADHVTRAVALFTAACDAGESDSCATAYSTAESAKLPANVALLEKGCAKEATGSCIALAKALRDGKGVARDAPRAAEIARKACDAKSDEGCVVLAEAYARGAGIARDTAKAAKLREDACEKGWPEACRALAAMARAGVGVARDPARAKALEAQAKALEED